MNPEFCTELLKTLMLESVMLAAPFLATAIVIGLIVSLFQAISGISEQTLTFVPKALGIVALLLLLMPWMIRNVVEFTTAVFEKLPQMAH
ncbi:MAG: flagellar biosynthetic protein FliQ [Verrucomicrobiota bacterium]|jgi:flagellar biosynthetic protein FliQ|nr:flagellar biosynthetic protein FliQ [Verrucomicrobiota bacterium]